jgi:hypothetical protein
MNIDFATFSTTAAQGTADIPSQQGSAPVTWGGLWQGPASERSDSRRSAAHFPRKPWKV